MAVFTAQTFCIALFVVLSRSKSFHSQFFNSIHWKKKGRNFESVKRVRKSHSIVVLVVFFTSRKMSFLGVLSIFFFSLWLATIDAAGYLYDDPDSSAPVQEYFSATKGNFQRSNKPRIVEFYSPSCVSSSWLSWRFLRPNPNTHSKWT